MTAEEQKQLIVKAGLIIEYQDKQIAALRSVIEAVSLYIGAMRIYPGGLRERIFNKLQSVLVLTEKR